MQRLIAHGYRAAVAAVPAWLVLAGSASADPWRPVTVGCSNPVATNGCSALRAGDGLWQVAVAPGGAHT